MATISYKNRRLQAFSYLLPSFSVFFSLYLSLPGSLSIFLSIPLSLAPSHSISSAHSKCLLHPSIDICSVWCADPCSWHMTLLLLVLGSYLPSNLFRLDDAHKKMRDEERQFIARWIIQSHSLYYMCYYGENCTRCVFFLIRLLPSPRHEKLRSAAIYKNRDIRARQKSRIRTEFIWGLHNNFCLVFSSM